MAVVELDMQEFRELHPYLSEEKISDASLRLLWDVAQDYVGNTDETSFFRYDPEATPPVLKRKWALYCVLCHLATLQVNNPSGTAGRVASASQGSVSTSFDLLRANSTVAQWWNQTECGATFWVMLSRFRLGGRLYRGGNYHPWG